MSEWWEADPRYGQAGWTLIHDGQLSYFVQAKPRKRRKPGRALRFGDLQVGTVLLHRMKWAQTETVAHAQPIANDDFREVVRTAWGFALVTDRWFDPVAGQADPVRGEMAGIVAITSSGQSTSKWAHTLRGLANHGYSYATPIQRQFILDTVAERARIVAEYDAGRMTLEEARAAVPPWRTLMRQCGLEDE